MGEFDLITRYFVPLTEGRKEAAGLRNDGAVLDIPAGKQLIVTTDTLVSGLHFIPDQPPGTIAQKALRTNLSDLTAMGAVPYCYQLALSMEKPDEAWLEDFCVGLASDNKRYGVFCSGGDTTGNHSGMLISITAFGLIDEGKAITRSGAKNGDHIVITGSIGAAYCGLQILNDKIRTVSDYCTQRYHAPQPPVSLGVILSDYVHAALDISDGLLADLEHMAKASHLQVEIDLSKLAFAPEVQKLLNENLVNIEELLSGGDDYELIMAVPDNKLEAFKAVALKNDVVLQDIGQFKEGEPDVIIYDETGKTLEIKKRGWQHF